MSSVIAASWIDKSVECNAASHKPVWIVSVRQTTRPESAKAGSDYFPGEF